MCKFFKSFHGSILTIFNNVDDETLDPEYTKFKFDLYLKLFKYN